MDFITLALAKKYADTVGENIIGGLMIETTKTYGLSNRDVLLNEDGYINSSGVFVSTYAGKCTNFIALGSDSSLSVDTYVFTYMSSVAFYNTNKEFISGVSGSEDWDHLEDSVTIPANAKYVRFSANTANTDVLFTLTSKSIKTGDNPLLNKILTCTGDSITVTTTNRPYAGYGKIIAGNNNMTYECRGIWGATIAKDVVQEGDIISTIENMRSDADYIILSGGVNDFYYIKNGDETLGSIIDGYSATLDETTFCGAMESICKQAITKWAGKKILYVITHRIIDFMNVSDLELVDGYIDKQIKILEKWGIPYVDLYHSMPTLFFDSLKNTYTTNGNTVYAGTGDGLHPNEAGYKTFYVPPIEAKLKTL